MLPVSATSGEWQDGQKDIVPSVNDSFYKRKMKGKSMKGNWKRHLEKLNAIGKKSWLIVTCDIVDFIHSTEMDHDGLKRLLKETIKWPRFRSMCDGFLQLDAKILPSGNLKIISNRHISDPSYAECSAFNFPCFDCGKIVKWEKFLQHFIAYVAISNLRVKHLTHDITYNPSNNTIKVCKIPDADIVVKLGKS
jgi:hypothetical protein